MNTLSVLKFTTIFTGGAFCAIFLLSLLIQSRETKVLGAYTQQTQGLQGKVQDVVGKKEQEQLSIVSKFLNNAITALENSPLLSPILKTSNDVGTALESAKNLPVDQRKAFCQQICPD